MASEPKHRLGRGLASLLGEPKAEPTISSVGEIGADRLDPNPYQPRGTIHPAELEELSASIKTSGVLQPLLVRPNPADPDRYQIIAGERRWRAARLAGLTSLPCLIRSLTDTEVAAAALVENLQRKDLNAIEEAEGFRQLVSRFGMTQEDLGVAVGKSRSHVANALRLLSLPSDVMDHVRHGALTAGHARAALAYADPSAAAATMITEGLNVRQAERLRTAETVRGDKKTARTERAVNADHAAVEADLAEQLGLRVEISWNGTGGTMKLQYRTLDQLDYIVAKLGGHG